MKINIGQKEIIHFIGMGGIGMSGLAQIMKIMGFKVQGSDINLNKNVENCKKLGIKFFIGQKRKNVKNATILVKSSAIKNNNQEVQEAKKKKLPIYERVEMLANIVSLKKNIIVSGSHGKTTTTSLVSKILLESNLDPTIINGGVINSIKNNAKLGKGDWAVLEADESDGSFLKLPINYSIVTNIDKEHLDFYKSLNNLKKKFSIFIEKTPSFGKSFICIDDKNNREILKNIKNVNLSTYGTNKNSNFQILNVVQNKDYSKFDLKISILGTKPKNINNIKIPIIGIHNIRNSTAAIAVASSIGISNNIIKKSLKKFQGVQRRFTKVFTFQNIPFFDDYAHHPTEIEEVLKGVKHAYKNQEIICAFQPHRISRVKDLKEEFSYAFKKADSVILCPIYTAGEKIKLGFSYLNFAKDIIKNSKVKLFLVNDNIQLAKFLKKNISGKKIVIGMGAGSISNWMKKIPNLM
mgnify:CR=1 FL=1